MRSLRFPGFGTVQPLLSTSHATKAAIASSRHRLLGMWNGPATAVCEGEVTYTRHNGSVLSVPFANVFDLRGDKIAAYRIYIDNSALFNDQP